MLPSVFGPIGSPHSDADGAAELQEHGAEPRLEASLRLGGLFLKGLALHQLRLRLRRPWSHDQRSEEPTVQAEG